MAQCKVITIANEKGGVGKTTTCRNLGAALSRAGMKVLLVDLNHQANLTLSVGIESLAALPVTISETMNSVLDGIDVIDGFIMRHNGIDIIPANKNLALTEINLGYEAGGEGILKEILATVQLKYDYILIDTGPTMGRLTINALAACDSVIIPISPEYWSATGFTDLIDTIAKIKRRINTRISIEGILVTMCEVHTILFREVMEMIHNCASGKVRIFDSIIPRTTKIGRANMHGIPIAEFEARNSAALAYMNLAEEVLIHDRESSKTNCASA